MSRVTVFGAGAMGTALAMHLARKGEDTRLWATKYDGKALEALRSEGKHPRLPHNIPSSLELLDTDDLKVAGDGCDIAVMAAHSGGARPLGLVVAPALAQGTTVVSIAKGLESETGKRMSEVYAEVCEGRPVVSVGGPALAGEIAEALPTAVVFAAPDAGALDAASTLFRSDRLHVHATDDVAGVEYCTLVKNVAAIGLGILDGLGKDDGQKYSNAKAALFSAAVDEMTTLIVALGGRRETVLGLAGLGDALVTSLGGRNRLYGELLGEGGKPDVVLDDLKAKGLTVEGVESAVDVQRLATERGLDLPFHARVHQVIFEGADPRSILETMNR